MEVLIILYAPLDVERMVTDDFTSINTSSKIPYLCLYDNEKGVSYNLLCLPLL